MRNSSHLNEEMNFLEMESSDRTHQHGGAPRPRSRDKRENTIRPVYLLMVVLVAVIFATLFMDSVEIKLSNKFFKPKNKQKKSVKDSDAFAASNRLESKHKAGTYHVLAPKESVPDVFPPKPLESEATPDEVVEPEPALEEAEPIPAKVTPPEPAPAPEVVSDPFLDVPVDTITEPAPALEETKIPLPVISPAAGEPGLKKHPAQLSDTYLLRGKPTDDATKKALAQTWGEWTFVDPKADKRPMENFYTDYPNRDVPREKFPADAWQTDKEYLSKFLPQAKALVERAMEAILSEYGHGKLDEPDKTFDERSKMFSFKMADLLGGEKLPKAYPFDIGGWTTERSFDGLARRILHAVMTEDQFTLVMSGHSSAAGHGNHLQQSYTMQFQKAMEPIFARLGVKCIAHNMGMGGMGTIQNALAAGDIYGKDVDILLWDSGMTEKGAIHLDVFARQGLMGGDRVPLLLSGSRDVLTTMHNLADADVGEVAGWGAAYSGIPKSVNATQVETIPWASRYIDCDKDFNGECRVQSYMGKCWYDRPDFTPPKQNAEPGGRAKWHPGNRFHQLRGRIITFPVLRALDKAITMWMDAEDYALPDDAWHVTDYYNNIRSKLASMNTTSTGCFDQPLPDGICKYPLHGRTEFTPRATPEQTSIRSLIKPGCYVPTPKKNIYDPPDVRNPNLDAPDGTVDLVGIVENGIDFLPNRARIESISKERRMAEHVHRKMDSQRELSNPDIIPGQGWGLNSFSAPGNCDGSYDSFCGRDESNTCLLYGHNDNRGGLLFDGYSGWLILNLDDFKHGIVVVKIEDWHLTGENKRTEGWTCENNASDCESSRRLETSLRGSTFAPEETIEKDEPRRLKSSAPPICDDFAFDFAIDGKITTWNRTEWEEHGEAIQRVVQTWTLMDDPDYTGGATKNVELAMRQRGCGRSRTFSLTHVYWS
jgi:hypothetical protein